jgi:ubiquinone/menaquinone biosynthesis C-methylase UbiE
LNLRKSHYGDQNHFYEFFYPRTIGVEAKGLRSVLWRYPHKIVEKKFKTNQGKTILEVGAGNGEHIPFVSKDFKRYISSDISTISLNRILEADNFEKLQVDAESLPFANDAFDRLIAMCLLAHLKNPEDALNEWLRVSKNGSTIQIYVPCEPGLALRFFRFLITAPAVKKMGYEGFDLFMAREHRNSALNLMRYIEEVFHFSKIKKIKRPFPFLSWNLNLFYIFEIEVKK